MERCRGSGGGAAEPLCLFLGSLPFRSLYIRGFLNPLLDFPGDVTIVEWLYVWWDWKEGVWPNTHRLSEEPRQAGLSMQNSFLPNYYSDRANHRISPWPAPDPGPRVGVG